MRDLRIQHLIDLGLADLENVEDQLKQMYEWHFEYSMTQVKLLLGASASLGAAILISLFENQITEFSWQVALGVSGALASATYGVYRFRELRRIHSEYVASLELMQRIRNLLPFVRLYRRNAGSN